MNTIPRVETERLLLRGITSDDYLLWLAAYANCSEPKDRFDKGPIPPEKRNRKHFLSRVRGMQKAAKEDRVYVFGIFLRDESKLVGAIDVGTYDRGTTQFANIGYHIVNQFFGYGFATEALITATTISLSELQFHRIEASINAENGPSIRVIEKAGYEFEGIRKRFWRSNGVWEDQLIYAKIAP